MIHRMLLADRTLIPDHACQLSIVMHLSRQPYMLGSQNGMNMACTAVDTRPMHALVLALQLPSDATLCMNSSSGLDLISAPLDGGLDVGGIGGRNLRFCHGKAASDLAPQQRQQPAALLLQGAIPATPSHASIILFNHPADDVSSLGSTGLCQIVLRWRQA